MLVSYTHRLDPDGQRFQQDSDTPLPKWAVNAMCSYDDVRKLEDRVHTLEASLEERRAALVFMRFV